MSTPHRGLPPPATMMPSSTQGPNSGLGQLPQQWQSSEESVRTWLQTKMEEERRKAEEERTRQEQMRGETRRVELEMMREAFQNGVPPPLVPLLFMGTGVVKTSSGEWVHEYVNQHLGMFHQTQLHIPAAQHPQSVVQPTSPSQAPPLRREGRSIHRMQQQCAPSISALSVQQARHASSSSTPSAQPLSGLAPLPPSSSYVTGYQVQPTTQGGVHPQQQSLQVQPLAHARTSLPRINTNELQVQQTSLPSNRSSNTQPTSMGPPPGSQIATHGTAAIPQAPSHTDNPSISQSPSIFFHHWVPPSTQSGPGGVQTSSAHVTASPQRQLDSPFSHNPPQNTLSGAEHISSPKKRKTTASQPQQPPPPSSQPFSPQSQPHSSPAPTPGRAKRVHSRNTSETSALRSFEYQRPMTRHRRSIGASETLDVVSGFQQGPLAPMNTSSGDSGRSTHNSNTIASSYSSHEHPQQSAPPLQHQQPPPRPYSAGSDFPRQPYPPPISRPPLSEASNDGERK